MKKSILLILFFLLMPMVPAASYALTVTIDGQIPSPNNPGNTFLRTNIAGNYVNQAGAIDLVIDTCPNCAGPPRVEISLANGLFQIGLTDARIKFLDTNPHTILFNTDPGDLGNACECTLTGGTYPHYVKVNGSFQNRPPLGTPARGDTIMIIGTGETDIIGGALYPTPDPQGTTSFSFQVVTSGSFATSPKVTESILCTNKIGTCDPGLSGKIIIQATVNNDMLLVPGSIDVGVITSTPAPPTLLLLGSLVGGWALCGPRRRVTRERKCQD